MHVCPLTQPEADAAAVGAAAAGPPKGHTSKEEAPQDVPSAAEWQTVASRTGAARNTAAPAPLVCLENRYEALTTLEEEEGEEATGEEATPRSPHSEEAEGDKQAQRRKHRVIVIGDSILRVSGHGRRHATCIVETDWQLRERCLKPGFDFLDNDQHITTRDVLGWDGLHLSPKGKHVFSSRLADLPRRALN